MTKTNSSEHRTVEAQAGIGFPDKFYVTIKLDAGLYLDQPIEEVEKVFDQEIRSIKVTALKKIRDMQREYKNQNKFKLASK